MSKVMGIYVKFTKSTHQIWSCHMTLASNSENFYLSPNSVLNFRKSYRKIGSRTKKLQAKNTLGVENTPPPPLLIGLNCKVSNEKGSSASLFTNAKVTSQILLDQSSPA